jgi:peroxiredoxin
MVSVGFEIPEITADAYYEGDSKKINFSDYKGKWLVLIFYPGDFTFVCPTELEEAAEKYEEFKNAGAEILSISTDSVWVHKAWHDTSPSIKKITFPMVSDTNGNISREFGTYIENEGVALRGSFIIDPDGVLRLMEINDNSVGRNVVELLRKLHAAKFTREHGEVCPVNWEPGKETLKPSMDLVGKI